MCPGMDTHTHTLKSEYKYQVLDRYSLNRYFTFYHYLYILIFGREAQISLNYNPISEDEARPSVIHKEERQTFLLPSLAPDSGWEEVWVLKGT